MSLYKIQLRNCLPLVAILVGVVIMGVPARAHAAFQLKLQQDAGAVTTITNPLSTGPSTFSGTIGSFAITITFGTSNSPGTVNAMSQLGSISITNTSSATHDLHLSVSAQDFTSPQSPPPLTLLDTVSGSVTAGTLLGTDFQGFADATNTLFGTGFAGQLLTIPTTGPASSFSKNGAKAGFSPDGAVYSLTIKENLRFASHTSITLTGGNVQALNPAPAPAGLMLLLTGLPVFGAWSYRRRKQAMAR